MTRYAQRPPEVDAIYYDGTNTQDIINFLNGTGSIVTQLDHPAAGYRADGERVVFPAATWAYRLDTYDTMWRELVNPSVFVLANGTPAVWSPEAFDNAYQLKTP
jgi:hypothetical protein